MIEHEGIIEEIEEQVARVRIESELACSSCHAKGVCGASEQKEKYLDIPVELERYTAGEKVRILVAKRLGIKAVALGYLFPFFLLIAVLAVLLAAGMEELQAGSFALLSLVPYYLSLYLFRRRLESTFSFTMQKLFSTP